LAFIRHCEGRRKSNLYWLEEPGDDRVRHLVVLLLESCPNCKQSVIEFYTIDWYGRKGPQLRTKQSDHPKWLERVGLHLVCDDKQKNKASKGTAKAMQTESLASEWSRLLKKNVALQFWKILKSLKEKPHISELKTQHGDCIRATHIRWRKIRRAR